MNTPKWAQERLGFAVWIALTTIFTIVAAPVIATSLWVHNARTKGLKDEQNGK